MSLSAQAVAVNCPVTISALLTGLQRGTTKYKLQDFKEALLSGYTWFTLAVKRRCYVCHQEGTHYVKFGRTTLNTNGSNDSVFTRT